MDVMVQGFARDIGDAVDATSKRLKRLSLVTWAPGTRERWIHIKPDKVTGRKIVALTGRAVSAKGTLAATRLEDGQVDT